MPKFCGLRRFPHERSPSREYMRRLQKLKKLLSCLRLIAQNNLGVSMELTALVNGDYTVAQYQEMFKQPVQDAITAIMGE